MFRVKVGFQAYIWKRIKRFLWKLMLLVSAWKLLKSVNCKTPHKHGKLPWKMKKWCAPVPPGGSDPILNSWGRNTRKCAAPQAVFCCLCYLQVRVCVCGGSCRTHNADASGCSCSVAECRKLSMKEKNIWLCVSLQCYFVCFTLCSFSASRSLSLLQWVRFCPLISPSFLVLMTNLKRALNQLVL